MSDTYRFDPDLPNLGRAFDLDGIAQLFAADWPGGDPPAAIERCRLQDTKYQPGTRCVTTYELQIRTHDGGSWRSIGVVEITPSGLTHRLFTDDPQLPALRTAMDDSAMLQRLQALPWNSGAPVTCRATPVRYRPEVRCVISYLVGTGAESAVVFGKLLVDGAAELQGRLEALHEHSQIATGMPRVLPPLAFWPDLRLVLQPAVRGATELNAIAFDPENDQHHRERWLWLAGARLGGLHASEGPPAAQRSLADDLAELREYVPPMAQVDPALASAYTAAVERLELMKQAVTTRTVASHGAFRTDQFLIEGSELVMIDLDGYCWADPARDIGNFQAYLAWKALRQPARAALIERGREMFLTGYAATLALPPAERIAVYEAASMLKIAGRRFRSLTVKEWPLVPRLLDLAEQRLAALS